MKHFYGLIVALGVVLPAHSAGAYPDQPVTFIVPFGAGGGADVTMRAMQPPLAEILETDIVVRNVGGAGGTIGAAEVAAARADGYTIGFLPIGPTTTQPHLRNLPYSDQSWEPICRVTNSPTVLATGPASGLESVDDVVSKAEAEPGELLYATPGPGSVPHVAMLAFADVMDIELTHVPHQGGAQMVKSALAGDVDFFMAVTPAVQQNELRPLVVMADERLEEFPDVPAIKELGHDSPFSIWYAMFAPAGTDEEIVEALSSACQQAVESEAFQDFAVKSKSQVAFQPRDEFSTFFHEEFERNGKVLEAAGLKAN